MTEGEPGGAEELRLARLTLRYLSRHPHAKDTREGIATWWVRQHQIEQALETVHRALELLVARDLIVQRRGPDLRAYYELNQQRPEEIARFLDESTP